MGGEKWGTSSNYDQTREQVHIHAVALRTEFLYFGRKVCIQNDAQNLTSLIYFFLSDLLGKVTTSPT